LLTRNRIPVLLLFLWVFSARAQGPECSVKTRNFLPGEILTYEVAYNWGVIWVDAGFAVFKANLGDYQGRKVYHFSGVGRTHDRYDWIFKVRDFYESYADTITLRPYKFFRDSREGSEHIIEDCRFSYKSGKAYSSIKKGKKTQIDSAAINPCTIDVMTAIYYARCIDFSKYKPNDTIPIELFLENKNYPVYIRYLGKEEKEIQGWGKFKCIKFRPLLIEGTIFKGGEDMVVWVSDETPILVGKIKVRITAMKGLRYPLTSLIGEK
jgi:hypothetical protein